MTGRARPLAGHRPRSQVAPQRANADIVVEVLPTQLVNDPEGKFLRVRLIQKTGLALIKAPFLFDEGSTIEWTPCGKKLTCAYPGARARRPLRSRPPARGDGPEAAPLAAAPARARTPPRLHASALALSPLPPNPDLRARAQASSSSTALRCTWARR